MDTGFLTDPAFLIFSSLFAIAIASGLIWHSILKNFDVAVLAASITGSLISSAGAWIWLGRPVGWSLFALMTLVCGVFAAGVGIPFYRRRTGKGLRRSFLMGFLEGGSIDA